MKRVHCLDNNGYKACRHKSIPKKYRNSRNYDTIDVNSITCKLCKIAIGKPFFSDEHLFEDMFRK